MSRKVKYIDVKEETFNAVLELKRKLGVKTYDELVRKLINIYNEYELLVKHNVVRKIICNDLKEGRAILSAWVKLLKSKLGSDDLVVNALEYLIPDPENRDYLIVDQKKCQ